MDNYNLSSLEKIQPSNSKAKLNLFGHWKRINLMKLLLMILITVVLTDFKNVLNSVCILVKFS